MDQWLNESMHEWTSDSEKIISESVTEWMSQRVDESMNQFNEPMNQWISGSMNPWSHESMNQWMKGWMDGWMDEWMEGWMDVRATFLCWVTSSLSDLFAEALFSQLLLLRAATYLGYFCSELPPNWLVWSSLRAAVAMRLAACSWNTE